MTSTQTSIGAAPSQEQLATRSRLLDRILTPRAGTWVEAAGLVALIVAYLAAAAWVSRIPLILGHDESVYALMARHWLEGTPDSPVGLHRAPLLPAMGLPIVAAGGGEMALRAVGIAFGVAAIVAVWWLGRTIRGPVAGLVAAAAFIFSTTVFEASTHFLTDLPATALLVAMATLLWRQFALRPAPNRLLLFVAPLAWAAYQLRYGSALVVVILFLTTAAMAPRKVRDSAGLVAGTIGLLTLLLVPHMVNATLDVGGPLGRLLFTSRVAGRDYLGQGLVEYLYWYPSELAGTSAALLMTVGLVGAVVVWLTGRTGPGLDDPQRHRRALIFLVVPAIVHTVAIGIASHGEPRFVFFAIALLCVAGAVVVTDALAAVAERAAPVVWVALVVAGVMLAGQVAWTARTESRERDRLAQQYTVLVESADVISAESDGECSVLTSYSPQMVWMTRCDVFDFGSPPEPGMETQLYGDGWMVLYQSGKRQPEGEVLDHYLSFSNEVASWDPPYEGRFGWGRLYRVDPAAYATDA